MSLQHLLQAIVTQADDDISAYKRASDDRLRVAKEHHATALSERSSAIAAQVEERKKLLRAKAETHAQLSRRSEVLKARQALVDGIFDSVLTSLASLPEAKTETLLKGLIKTLPNKGTVRPTKKHEAILKKLLHGSSLHLGSPVEGAGGFVFENETVEMTCTYDHLVRSELRSGHELWVSKQLAS